MSKNDYMLLMLTVFIQNQLSRLAASLKLSSCVRVFAAYTEIVTNQTQMLHHVEIPISIWCARDVCQLLTSCALSCNVSMLLCSVLINCELAHHQISRKQTCEAVTNNKRFGGNLLFVNEQRTKD